VLATGRHIVKLTGYAPDLPTPFTDDDEVDYETFEWLCELQIMHGATALVVGGATGEAWALSSGEHAELIRIAAGVARGRLPVVAGAGSNATSDAVAPGKIAEVNGADAILSVSPYYNKPTQDGLRAHYREIAAASGLPIILHDVPSRTVRGLTDESVARLAEGKQIIGLMDATGDVGRPSRLRALVGSDFRLLSGDDATALGFLAQGGDGCISVASNIAPGLCQRMYLAWQQGHVKRARRIMIPLTQLTAVLARETNPAPLKYALSLCGLTSPRVRLPLAGVTEETQCAIAETMQELWKKYSDFMIERLLMSSLANPLSVPKRDFLHCLLG
jgi:4-hydroxy-tetrahydrodipicolinate synthase